MLIDLATISFAAILVAAGAAAFLLAVLHPPARTVPLMSFGAGVWMYGSRVFAELPAFRAVAPGDPVWWDHVVGILTYFLPVVTFLFTEHFLGAGWRSSIRRVWQGHLVFAVGAVAVDLATRTPQASVTVSSVVVILEMGVVLANLVARTFRIDHEVRIVRRALVVLVVSIANDNLVWLGLVPWRVLVEPLGVAIFIGALGYAVVLRSLGNERRLGILDHELQTARHIQRSLLPHDLSSAPGTELAARYVPMTAVGGDFYDTLPIGRQRLGLLVADVAGHGVPAALIASMVKTAAAAQRGVGDNPAAVLDGINKYLCGQIDGHYVTAVYVCIDTDAGCLRHASAGHPAPLLWSQRQGRVVEVGESGLLLGFVPEAEASSGSGCHVHDDQRQVVVELERRSPGPLGQSLQKTVGPVFGRERVLSLELLYETTDVEEGPGRGRGFHHAIRKQDEPVARSEHDLGCRVLGVDPEDRTIRNRYTGVMTNQASVAEPYTLWYETLPSDDTARLTIARRGERFHAALFWNRKPHSERSFSTRDDAEAWGYELHAIVMQDALAGVLLGYDADVVTTLTNAVNL